MLLGQNAPPPAWQELSWVVAAVAGTCTLVLALYQLVRSHRQQSRDLRFQQARFGKEFFDDIFADEHALSALDIIDGQKLGHVFPSGEKPIDLEVVKRALSAEPVNHSEECRYVRDCFDMLLFYLDRAEHFVRVELVQFEDIISPLGYYAGKLAAIKPEFARYVQSTQYPRVLALLDRFQVWKGAGNESQEARHTSGQPA